MNRTKLLLILLILVFSAILFPLKAGSIEKGVTNLTKIHLTSTISLNGPWQYYYGNFLSATEMQQLPEEQKRYATLPSRWNNRQKYPGQLSNLGCMTYYLQLIVNPSVTGKFAGIKFYTISSAYRVIVNDEEVLTMGQPSRTREGSKSDRSAHLLHLTLTSDTLHLVLHVSNYCLSNYGGVTQPIVFGPIEEIEKQNFRDYAKTFFFSTAFFILFFLHLLIFMIRGKEITHMQIAIISLLFMLKMLTENEHVLLKYSTWMDLAIEYKLWNATLLLFPIVLSFSQKLFPDDIPEKLSKISYLVFAGMLILIVFLPLQLLTSISHYLVLPPFLGILYLLFVLLIAMKKKRKYAFVYFIALFVMFIGFINDMFYVTDLYRSELKAHIGGLVFLSIQTWIVITRYARSHEQMGRLQQELISINQNLEKTIEQHTIQLKKANFQLARSNKHQELIITTISHDLMNIFNNLRYFSNDLLHRQLLKPEIASDVQRIQNNTENGLNILNNILDWRSVQESQCSQPVKIAHLSKIITECISQQVDAISGKSVHIQTDINDELVFWCDYNQLYSIVRNLLSNAVKFTSQNGHILISNRRVEQMVEICINDDGIGMPEWIKDNLFTLRKDKKREGTRGEIGSGIGLILTRELLDNNDGTIRIVSQPGKGTTVVIAFPVNEHNKQVEFSKS